MKRFILNLGAMAVLCGAMSSPLMAAPVHGGHGPIGHGGVHVVGGFHGLHHGYGGYLARDYHGWGRFYWNARYRCNWYFCPEANCYYYYYAPGECYLPESQVALYPPTVNIVNNNVNNVNVGPGALMPVPQ